MAFKVLCHTKFPSRMQLWCLKTSYLRLDGPLSKKYATSDVAYFFDRAQRWDWKRSTRKLAYTNTSYNYRIQLIACRLDHKATHPDECTSQRTNRSQRGDIGQKRKQTTLTVLLQFGSPNSTHHEEYLAATWPTHKAH